MKAGLDGHEVALVVIRLLGASVPAVAVGFDNWLTLDLLTLVVPDLIDYCRKIYLLKMCLDDY